MSKRSQWPRAELRSILSPLSVLPLCEDASGECHSPCTAVGLLGANPHELCDDGERGTWGEKDMRYGLVGKEPPGMLVPGRADARPIGTSPTMIDCVIVPILVDRTGDIGGSDASTDDNRSISTTYSVLKDLTYPNQHPARSQSRPLQPSLAAYSQSSSSPERACSILAPYWGRLSAATGRV